MTKDLLAANIFSDFPSWKSVVYAGESTPKILKFEVAVEGEDPRPLYLASIISREEKMAWQSFQDVLEHTMGLAQNRAFGFFGFDVLTVDIRAGLRNFNPGDLSRLIINHARELGAVPIPINRSGAEIGAVPTPINFNEVEIGAALTTFDQEKIKTSAVPTAVNEKKIKVGADQKALIRYGQLFALLHYRAPADWGKIEVKTHVEFFSQGSASAEVTEASVRAALMGLGAKNKNSAGDQLDLLLKKLLKEGHQEPRAIYILQDLSVDPVWDPDNEVQQQRTRAWFEKETQARNGVSPEIYLYHSAARTRIELSRYLKC